MVFHTLAALADNFQDLPVGDIVVSTKRIQFKEFPGAFNPSILKVDQGYLLVFRDIPDPDYFLWDSDIVIVRLDANFDPISEPEILNTRSLISKTNSHSEDARLFSYRGRIFVIYNDNIDQVIPNYWDRRDMFIAELTEVNGQFQLTVPLKLVYEEVYKHVACQKNWMPFESNGKLLFIYSISPHKILYPNLLNGACYSCYETSALIDWPLGKLRGSSPPLLVDGEYLVFFHSAMPTTSVASSGQELWHYFMGAYTFSPKPPFEITKITPRPIVGEGFYTKSNCQKRVIFPGGFVDDGDHLHVAYGKDDCEMWIATLDKAALKREMVSLE